MDVGEIEKGMVGGNGMVGGGFGVGIGGSI